jgi:hypothetical protein
VQGQSYCGTVYRGCWVAPEVLECRSHAGSYYTTEADTWPLGLVFYFIAARGVQPIVNEKEAADSAEDEHRRSSILQRTRAFLVGNRGTAPPLPHLTPGWALFSAFPILFDLIELMVRPITPGGPARSRIKLEVAAAHPFFWDPTIAARIITEVSNEMKNRAYPLRDFIQEFNATCATGVLQNGWDRNHPMFKYTTGLYATREATSLLKILRDTLEHGREHVRKSTTFLCIEHFKKVVMEAFLRSYGPVFCELFRVTLTTVQLPDGSHAPRYGVWSNAFQQNFKFTFHQTPL